MVQWRASTKDSICKLKEGQAHINKFRADLSQYIRAFGHVGMQRWAAGHYTTITSIMRTLHRVNTLQTMEGTTAFSHTQPARPDHHNTPIHTPRHSLTCLCCPPSLSPSKCLWIIEIGVIDINSIFWKYKSSGLKKEKKEVVPRRGATVWETNWRSDVRQLICLQDNIIWHWRDISLHLYTRLSSLSGGEKCLASIGKPRQPSKVQATQTRVSNEGLGREGGRPD